MSHIDRHEKPFTVPHTIDCGTDDDREYLEYWLSRPPGERIAAVEFLREQFYPDRQGENSPRLVRTITIREIL